MEKVTIDEAIQTLQAILDATESTDKEQVTRCGKLKGQIVALGEYERSLNEKYIEQSKQLKQMILNDTLPSKGIPDETGASTPKALSLEECIANITKGK